MGFIVKIILTALAAYFSAMITPGVSIKSFGSAIIVALVLTLLNIFVKPILQFISIPVTLVTLGLFLLVINAVIILLAAYFLTSSLRHPKGPNGRKGAVGSCAPG